MLCAYPMHPLITIVIAIALGGLLVWAITTLIPMPDPFKKAIYVICVVALVLFVLSTFGLIDGYSPAAHWRRPL